MAEPFRAERIDLVAAAEARGFIFAAPLAVALGAGLVPIRKPGKLPGKTLSHTYELEYGTDTLQIHADAVSPGANVLMVDDLLGNRRHDPGLLPHGRGGGRPRGRLRVSDRAGRPWAAPPGLPSTGPSA